jgi:hypothetical protein
VQSLKVEILVPKFFNNGNRIPVKKHRLTAQELSKQFDGCTEDKSPLFGQWIDPKTKRKYIDKNFAFWVICKDSKTNLEFFRTFKGSLKRRYNQEEILIYSISITSI